MRMQWTAMRAPTKVLYTMWNRVAVPGARSAPSNQQNPAKGSPHCSIKRSALGWGGRIAVVLLALLCSIACGSTYAQGRGSYPTYPSQRGTIYRGGYNDPAYSRGYDDGYRKGLEAARDGDRYDVRREGLYRDGDRGYDSRYGSRNQWRQAYRDGFTTGYDQGYRNARSQNGRYRRRY